MRTYWLVTVSGFQGSSCGGFPAYPAVLPAACHLTCVRRQGDTLRTHHERVNGFSEVFPAAVGSPSESVRENKKASRISVGRRHERHGAICFGNRFAIGSSPDPSSFSTHTLQPRNDFWRCGAVLYQRPHCGARGLLGRLHCARLRDEDTLVPARVRDVREPGCP
jgi:hypothetical protein